MINITSLAEVMINMIIRHHSLSNSIDNDWNSLFISKFCCLLCYFLDIRWKFSTIFDTQTDGQINGQNNIMEVHLDIFIN